MGFYYDHYDNVALKNLLNIFTTSLIEEKTDQECDEGDSRAFCQGDTNPLYATVQCIMWFFSGWYLERAGAINPLRSEMTRVRAIA